MGIFNFFNLEIPIAINSIPKIKYRLNVIKPTKSIEIAVGSGVFNWFNIRNKFTILRIANNKSTIPKITIRIAIFRFDIGIKLLCLKLHVFNYKHQFLEILLM